MNAVMIVPTGLGCNIGGHAGDANPFATLLASVCDRLLLHPNVVNASDINEMPDNALYIEGSILDRFLSNKINLKEVKSNKILLVVNKPIDIDTINSVSAARATLGADISIMELDVPLTMIARIEGDKAGGDVDGWEELVDQVSDYEYDALAVQSIIQFDKEVEQAYIKGEILVNPWGGVEAIASKLIANKVNKPVAHAPLMTELYKFTHIVDPRLAAEFVSISYLFCVMKGLHKAPRVIEKSVIEGLNVKDIDVMISPSGCYGPPHEYCMNYDIPIIAVKNNFTISGGNAILPTFIEAATYMEAVGIIQSMKLGISLASLSRPLDKTEVL